MSNCLACERKCKDVSECLLNKTKRVSVADLCEIRDLMVRYQKDDAVQTLNAVINRYKREGLRVKNRYLDYGKPQALTNQEKQIYADLEAENPID